MTKNNMNFVSLHLNATIDYAAGLEEINFYEYKTIVVNLFADDNQTVELRFKEFQLDMYSDDKVKYIVNLRNAMNDVNYNHEYLDSLNLNECKKGEIIFDGAGSYQIKLPLDIDYINISAQIPQDEFGELMVKIADEDEEVFKALVDK